MATFKAGARKRQPTHPGQIVKTEIDDAGETVYSVAPRLGVSRMHLGSVVKGDAPVTTDMALRLGKFFGNGPEIWLALQTDYDLWEARQRMADALKVIKPLARQRSHLP